MAVVVGCGTAKVDEEADKVQSCLMCRCGYYDPFRSAQKPEWWQLGKDGREGRGCMTAGGDEK